MDLSAFINNYREAFGEKAPLPIIFYYSNQANKRMLVQGNGGREKR